MVAPSAWEQGVVLQVARASAQRQAEVRLPSCSAEDAIFRGAGRSEGKSTDSGAHEFVERSFGMRSLAPVPRRGQS